MGELIVILAIALIFLGPKRLPELATGLGKAIRQFRKATRDLSDQIEVDESVRKPIAETVQQIASATSEQAKGSEQIIRSAEKMRAITKHVERSSQEQTRGGKQITKSIESISEMVAQLNSAQREQARGGDQILQAVEQLREISKVQETRFGELSKLVDHLRRSSDLTRNRARA